LGISHRRRRRGQVDLARAGFARHLHDLLAGGAAHDRIVDQQHDLVAELELHRVELAAHRFHALLLPRHDEGAADVAVLDEALAIFDAEHFAHRNRSAARGIGDRDDDVDVVIRAQAPDFLRQALAHAQPGLVDRDVLDHRIRTRQIDVLEDARCVHLYSWAHWRARIWPSSVISTASPGATSRTRLKPRMSRATLSDASAHSVPSGPSRLPITSGRMPFGSRKPTMP
jgi:hypothetical protein